MFELLYGRRRHCNVQLQLDEVEETRLAWQVIHSKIRSGRQRRTEGKTAPFRSASFVGSGFVVCCASFYESDGKADSSLIWSAGFACPFW
jgi:hypothetical protein